MAKAKKTAKKAAQKKASSRAKTKPKSKIKAKAKPKEKPKAKAKPKATSKAKAKSNVTAVSQKASSKKVNTVSKKKAKTQTKKAARASTAKKTAKTAKSAKKGTPVATAKKVSGRAAPKPVKKSVTPKTAKTSTGRAAGGAKVLSMDKARQSKKSSNAAINKIFSPLDDRVVVQKAGVAERTPGGLYIPETVESVERPNQGQVVAVGPGRRSKKGKLRPLDVHLGDTVMFNTYAGAELTLNGVEVVVLREDEILAVVKS